ncbi:MAG: hypothetical protein K6G64_10190 [Eubacterium sp.]|nr:hypothetical protein [Eubacterium sp.]
MNQLERDFMEEKLKAEELLHKINRELNQVKPDDAKVKVSSKGKSLQLYIRETKEDGANGRYMSLAEKDRAVNIVRGEYYGNLKETLENKLKFYEKGMKFLHKTKLSEVYRKLGKGKQKLVDPIELSDEQYRALWEQCEYEGKVFDEYAAEIYTERGERVRSKSEKILADKLYRENIAYRYEYPLKISNSVVVYPDFTILDEIKRRNIIFEHFGMMDNAEYANNAISKMQMYAREGYVLGDNLFVTMETSARPLDSRMLEGIVELIKGEWNVE